MSTSRPLGPPRHGIESAAATRIIGSSVVRDSFDDRRGVAYHELGEQMLGERRRHGVTFEKVLTR
jgi:hypothetical protein